MQRCQFKFLNQSLKTTRKIREKIRGVFGRFEKHFSGPDYNYLSGAHVTVDSIWPIYLAQKFMA